MKHLVSKNKNEAAHAPVFDREHTIRGLPTPPMLIRVKDVTSLVSWFNGKVFVFTSLSISHSIDERNIFNFKG